VLFSHLLAHLLEIVPRSRCIHMVIWYNIHASICVPFLLSSPPSIMDIPPPYNKNINSATTRAASSNYLSVDMRNSVRGEANNAGPPLRINNEQHPKPALTDEQIGKEGASVLVCVVVYSVLFTLDQLGVSSVMVARGG
jgi:hypothetical protein